MNAGSLPTEIGARQLFYDDDYYYYFDGVQPNAAIMANVLRWDSLQNFTYSSIATYLGVCVCVLYVQYDVEMNGKLLND